MKHKEEQQTFWQVIEPGVLTETEKVISKFEQQAKFEN